MDHIEMSSTTDITKGLHDLVDKLKCPDVRETLAEETLTQVIDLFTVTTATVCTDQLGNATIDELGSKINLATESARFVRNACAGCRKNQDVVSKKPELYHHLLQIIKHFCSTEKSHAQFKENYLTLLKCSLQMLGNSIVQHSENGSSVWKLFFEIFGDMIHLRDTSLFSCSCMIIHNCLLADPAVHTTQLVTTPTGQQIICDTLERLTHDTQEWGLFILERTAKHPDFLEIIYKTAGENQRHFLFDTILTLLEKMPEDSDISSAEVTVDVQNVKYVCEEFKRNAHSVLGMSQMQDFEQESPLVVKQLAILCSATSNPKLYVEIMDDQDLLKCSINLLHCTHMIGQEGDNTFSNISKVSRLADCDTSHPVHGLKRDLIRLVANLAYKHKENQDMVRELGGIPLIMDHTNIDGRNPFITQWAVFAIRNLLDSNPDNQAVVAGMKLTGLADNVEKLREFGVEAELRDGKIIVKDAKDTESSPFTK